MDETEERRLRKARRDRELAEAVQKQQAETAKNNAEAELRMSERPTPTQAENDRAALGAPVWEKTVEKVEKVEVSEPEEKAVEAEPPVATYKTRTLVSGKK